MTRKLLIAGVLATLVGMIGLGLASASYEPEANGLSFGLTNAAAILQTSAFSPNGGHIGSTLLISDTEPLSPTLPMTGPVKVIMAITNFFSGTVTATQVISMHNSGWGFGEIFKMYLLVEKYGKNADDIQAMRQSGMGWGQIMKDMDLPPGNKGANLGAAVSGRMTSVMSTTVGSGVKPNKEIGKGPPGKTDDQEDIQTSTNGPGQGKGKGKGKGRGK